MPESSKGVFVDLLDGTFHVMAGTWATSLLLGGVLFFPTSYLFGWAYGRFFDALGSITRLGGSDPMAMLMLLGRAYLWIFVAALAQGLVLLFVRAAVTAHAALAIRGVPANPFTVVPEVLRTKYLLLLGQRLLQWLILSITLSAALTLTGLLVGVAIGLTWTALAIILGVILGSASIGVYLWAAVRFSLTLESLVIDGTKIEESLDNSAALVRRNWWRIFGYTLLFGLMVGFASSIIATPIMFFSSIRQYGDFLRSILSERSGSGGFNATLMKLMAGMGRKMGLFAYIRSLIACFVSPVFMTLLFFEMKRRRAGRMSP